MSKDTPEEPSSNDDSIEDDNKKLYKELREGTKDLLVRLLKKEPTGNKIVSQDWRHRRSHPCPPELQSSNQRASHQRQNRLPKEEAKRREPEKPDTPTMSKDTSEESSSQSHSTDDENTKSYVELKEEAKDSDKDPLRNMGSSPNIPSEDWGDRQSHAWPHEPRSSNEGQDLIPEEELKRREP